MWLHIHDISNKIGPLVHDIQWDVSEVLHRYHRNIYMVTRLAWLDTATKNMSRFL